MLWAGVHDVHTFGMGPQRSSELPPKGSCYVDAMCKIHGRWVCVAASKTSVHIRVSTLDVMLRCIEEFSERLESVPNK